MPSDGRQPLTPNGPHLTERTPAGRCLRNPQPGWRPRLILIRLCSEAVASMAAIESTIDSRVNRLLCDFIQKMVGAYRPRTDDAQCPRTDDNQ